MPPAEDTATAERDLDIAGGEITIGEVEKVIRQLKKNNNNKHHGRMEFFQKCLKYMKTSCL